MNNASAPLTSKVNNEATAGAAGVPSRIVTVKLVLSDLEAAELFGCSRAHWRNLHRMGLCPAPIKLGRSTRWQREELIDWCNAGMPPRHRWSWSAKREDRR